MQCTFGTVYYISREEVLAIPLPVVETYREMIEMSSESIQVDRS